MTLVVAGIDLAAGRGKTEVAVLTADGDSGRPRFHAARHVPVSSDEEILDVITHTAPCVIAIDAPLSLPRAVDVALHAAPEAASRTGTYGSPYTRAAERSPAWKDVGVRPLPVSFLGGLVFRAIALLPALRAVAPEATIIEVFPTGSLRQLGVTDRAATTAAGERLSKTSESARGVVQNGLSHWIDGIPDPVAHLVSADLLDALAAALTAICYAAHTYVAVGDADEGQIILPRAQERHPGTHCL